VLHFGQGRQYQSALCQAAQSASPAAGMRHPNNAFERSVKRYRVRAASAARHQVLPARSRAHRAAAQRER